MVILIKPRFDGAKGVAYICLTLLCRYKYIGRRWKLLQILYVHHSRRLKMEMRGFLCVENGTFEAGFKELSTRFNAVKCRRKEVDSFIFLRAFHVCSAFETVRVRSWVIKSSLFNFHSFVLS